jgi:hypothetical protein
MIYTYFELSSKLLINVFKLETYTPLGGLQDI